nr:putative ribonuclease H-like domain-containing protein [Tanacetum cinerariifolium]
MHEVSDDEEETVEKKEVKPSINWVNFVKATTNNNHKETVKNALTVNAARPINVVHPKRTINAVNQKSYFSKQAHSFFQRPNKKLTALKNSYANKKVKTVWVKKVNTAKPKAAVNAAKAKAKHKAGNPQEHLQDKGVIDSGFSRHMIGNISFLIEYEEINRGYVAFGGNPKGRKITSKGTKDETSGTLKSFITRVENLMNLRVKVIRCDNGTEFKNREMNRFCEVEGKFDEKADEGFFVGYPLNSNGAGKEKEPERDYIMLLLWTADSPYSTLSKISQDNEFQPSNDGAKKVDEDLRKENEWNDQGEEDSTNSTNRVNIVSSNINAASSSGVTAIGKNISIDLPPDLNMPSLEDIGIFEDSHDDEDVFGAEADFHNLDSTIQVSPIPTTRIYKDHPLKQVIGDLHSASQTIRMTKNLEEHEEEVYVCQPHRFEDPDFPDKVYKVEKAIYGLHQAPRAWYETLSTYLLDNRFKRRQIDKTLFIKTNKGDILLVQVYFDDIIFGSTKKEMCDAFEILMHEKFQMSSIGELTFFLGLQVKPKKEGILIGQDKYVAEILKKFRFLDVKKASTPMETSNPLLKDEDREEVDVHMYRSMIGSLMYLTSSRAYIMFAVCACLWYPKDSPFDLVAYTNSDYAGASIDRKSTTRGCQFLGCRLISWQCKKQNVDANSTTEAEYVAALSCCGQVQFLEFLASMEGVALIDMRDRWVWSLKGSRDFSVAFVRRLIDECWLLEVSTKTHWINVVPIKVNVHAWKVSFGVDDAQGIQEKHATCLMLLVKDLVLPSQDDVVD